MEVIYDRHEQEWEKCLNDEQRSKIAATWMQEGTLDRWRHTRMLAAVIPFISSETNWLTVGDGRYGTDAHFIISHGGIAHASDISDKLLKIGSDEGFIGEFSSQNAENLGFPDDSFDYVLIKEAFHHFPRPWIALHEAFRVCRKAVILIEPSDENCYLRNSPSQALKVLATSCKKIARKAMRKNPQTNGYWFEPVGNFVYSINERELEKFLLGMHYRFIGTTRVNDAYQEGVEFINLSNPSKKELKVINKIQSQIRTKDLLCKAGILTEGILACALFKEEPTVYLKKKANAAGWNIKELPKNPYL